MKNFLPLLSVGGFEVYFGIYELSTNLHHLTSPHFHICTNDDGNDIQISEEEKVQYCFTQFNLKYHQIQKFC